MCVGLSIVGTSNFTYIYGRWEWSHNCPIWLAINNHENCHFMSKVEMRCKIFNGSKRRYPLSLNNRTCYPNCVNYKKTGHGVYILSAMSNLVFSHVILVLVLNYKPLINHSNIGVYLRTMTPQGPYNLMLWMSTITFREQASIEIWNTSVQTKCFLSQSLSFFRPYAYRKNLTYRHFPQP